MVFQAEARLFLLPLFALSATVLFGLLLVRLAVPLGFMDLPGDRNKVHTRPTPRTGGLVMVLGGGHGPSPAQETRHDFLHRRPLHLPPSSEAALFSKAEIGSGLKEKCIIDLAKFLNSVTI